MKETKDLKRNERNLKKLKKAFTKNKTIKGKRGKGIYKSKKKYYNI